MEWYVFLLPLPPSNFHTLSTHVTDRPKTLSNKTTSIQSPPASSKPSQP